MYFYIESLLEGSAEGHRKSQKFDAARPAAQIFTPSSGRQDCIHALSYYTVQTLQLLSQSFELSSALQRLIHYLETFVLAGAVSEEGEGVKLTIMP